MAVPFVLFPRSSLLALKLVRQPGRARVLVCAGLLVVMLTACAVPACRNDHLKQHALDRVVDKSFLAHTSDFFAKIVFEDYPPGTPIEKAVKDFESFGAVCTKLDNPNETKCIYKNYINCGSKSFFFGVERLSVRWLDYHFELISRDGKLLAVRVDVTFPRDS